MQQEENKNSLLLKAVKTILRPLIKLLLAHQITYSDLTKLLKSLYIETAEQDFRLDDKPQTDSRLSLLTGIHRKEVKNLRQQITSGESDQPNPSAAAIPAQIVATWLGDAIYTDEKGVPKILTHYISEETEETPSFERLVQQTSKGNLRVAPVLSECEHLGLVELLDEKKVKLNASAFVPNEDFTSKTDFFSTNLGAHMNTCCHNLLLDERERGLPLASDNPLFDRSVDYNNLPEEAIESLQQLLKDKGMQLLVEANRKAKNAQEQGHSSVDMDQSPKHRMTLGLYFYSEPQNMTPNDSENSTDNRIKNDPATKGE